MHRIKSAMKYNSTRLRNEAIVALERRSISVPSPCAVPVICTLARSKLPQISAMRATTMKIEDAVNLNLKLQQRRPNTMNVRPITGMTGYSGKNN